VYIFCLTLTYPVAVVLFSHKSSGLTMIKQHIRDSDACALYKLIVECELNINEADSAVNSQTCFAILVLILDEWY